MDLETCPRRYYHTYIFPIPILEEDVEQAQDHGSIVHAYIEGGMRGVPPKVLRNGTDGNGHALRNNLWKAFDASEHGRTPRSGAA